jgi:hypothetical protein
VLVLVLVLVIYSDRDGDVDSDEIYVGVDVDWEGSSVWVIEVSSVVWLPLVVYQWKLVEWSAITRMKNTSVAPTSVFSSVHAQQARLEEENKKLFHVVCFCPMKRKPLIQNDYKVELCRKSPCLGSLRGFPVQKNKAVESSEGGGSGVRLKVRRKQKNVCFSFSTHSQPFLL